MNNPDIQSESPSRPKRSWKRFFIKLIILAAVIAAVGGGIFLLRQNKEAEADQAKETGKALRADEEAAAFAVNTTRAVSGQIKNYIEINGDVQASTEVDILPDTSGKLSQILVDVGSEVRKDQVIAKVDPSRPGAQFAASPVKAPISGTITDVPAQIGSTVAPSVPIARVGRMDDLEITARVAEKFISRMKTGLPALLRFEAYPAERFRARVSQISPVVDPQTRTVEVTMKLSERDPRIKAGMFTEVKIITEEKRNVVKLPAQALVKRFGGYYVFVVPPLPKDAPEDANPRAERRKVNPGIEIDGKLEITKGLQGGERVVIRGQSLLEDQTPVRVIKEIQPLTEADTVE